MIKIKMLLLAFQIDKMLKETVPRKSEYLEIKKILDSIINKIAEVKAEII